jgi:hypothetical protein
MSIKRFNEFEKLNEALGSQLFNDLYGKLKKMYKEALADYRKADKEYREHNERERDGAEYDGSYYTRKTDAKKRYEKFSNPYQNMKSFIEHLSWQGMNLEEISDDMIEIVDTREGDDATKLRRKPYSQENYYVLALQELKTGVHKRDKAIGDVLDEEIEDVILVPVGYFQGTHTVGGTGLGYRQNWDNRKDIIEAGTVFYVIKAERDPARQELQDERRERQRDIVQPTMPYYGRQKDSGESPYDTNFRKQNIERYADKLASKKNYDHIHDVMVNIFKLKNKIEVKYLDSLKSAESGRAGDSGLKKAIVDFVNTHGSDITVSDYNLYSKTTASILNELFNDYLSAYRTVKRERSDKSSSLKKLAAFDILLPDLEKFMKKYKPGKK